MSAAGRRIAGPFPRPRSPHRIAEQVPRRRAPCAVLALAACTLLPFPTDAQDPPATDSAVVTGASLGGVAIDARTRVPLRDAGLLLDAEARARTDAFGRFELDRLEPGSRTLQVEVDGRLTAPRSVELEAGRHTEIRIAIRLPADDPPSPRDIVELPPLEVQISRTDGVGKLRDFYRRARAGRGTYLTEDDIERRAPRRLSDLLREAADVRVAGAGARGPALRSNRGCPLVVWVDGSEVRGLHPDEIPPGDVQAIEIYTSATGTPARFRSFRGCGAVVIWTLDPG